ncbi:cysteine--tRNA ligase, partial [Gammaproteobacteria bacterium]|nr:cysteine--tRNA ligase [Gammaproteobacteria bacterium]
MKLYDSQTRKKVPLQLDQALFKLYVCGLTVYDQAHIGHLRTMLVFDLLVRILRDQGVLVQYVRNITDVDDKIINRANQEGVSWQQLTQTVIEGIQAQERKLRLIQPDIEPKASEYIDEMIAMIQTLVDKGYAYVSSSGDVCFSVSAYPEYGQLSKQNLDELKSSARVEQGEKESAHDFVLWKMSKPDEPAWDSPWGKGRPGWHIECSAMSTKLLGKTFDLHGGGLDLKFPHHENEIAQSCCATDEAFARHWMHVTPLLVQGEKMSKSLGNFVTINDALAKYHPDILRFYLLKTHYRMPLNYEYQGLLQAQKNILSIYQALLGDIGHADEHAAHWVSFTQYLNDDLNVAGAIGVIHDCISQLKTKDDRAVLLRMVQQLGVGFEAPLDYLQHGVDQNEIEQLLIRRQQARQDKLYAQADAIRDEIAVKGIIVEDTPN